MPTPPLADRDTSECDRTDRQESAATLDATHVQQRLAAIPEWELREGRLHRTYWIPTFRTSVDFLHAIADITEPADHHPDVAVHGNRRVEVSLWTHGLHGLTELDFSIAQAIDTLYPDFIRLRPRIKIDSENCDRASPSTDSLVHRPFPQCSIINEITSVPVAVGFMTVPPQEGFIMTYIYSDEDHRPSFDKDATYEIQADLEWSAHACIFYDIVYVGKEVDALTETWRCYFRWY